MDKLAEFDNAYFESKLNQLQLTVLDSGCVNLDSSWKWVDVASPFNRLYFILEGAGALVFDDKTLALTPNFVYLIPAHSKNTYLCEHFMKQYFFAFQMEVVPGHDFFETLKQPVSLPTPVDFLHQLCIHTGISSVSNALWLKAKIYEFLTDFSALCTEDAFEKMHLYEKYKPIYDMVENGIAQKMAPAQIHTAIRRIYTARLRTFQADTHCTLYTHITARVLQKAKEKLACSDISIGQLAAVLGYSDEFYFSRVFKKHVGIAPSVYRRRCLSSSH
ncbi:MAG: helix-turn-helix domain-containing protein [Ruthenibacterium sp.]